MLNHESKEISLFHFQSLSATARPRNALSDFLLECGRKSHTITGDGNCYFRAISHLLFGSEDNHLEIRTLLVRFINHNKTVFEKYLMQVNESTIQAHIKKLLRPSTWATQVEVLATASVFGISVYYCTPTSSGNFHWEVLKPLNDQLNQLTFLFPPELSETLTIPRHLELSLVHNHYDCVVSLKTGYLCSTPPQLYGPSTFMDLTS